VKQRRFHGGRHGRSGPAIARAAAGEIQAGHKGPGKDWMGNRRAGQIDPTGGLTPPPGGSMPMGGGGSPSLGGGIGGGQSPSAAPSGMPSAGPGPDDSLGGL
jgi:hypothetical protein